MIEAQDPLLTWEWDGDEWIAYSAFTDEGAKFAYRISFNKDGLFDVSDSDPQLIGSKKIDKKHTLAAAKAWCEGNESCMRLIEGVEASQ